MNKKLLVVQFRTDASKPHEQDCLTQDLHEYADRLEFVSAIDNELPTNLSSYAGVILGGSGEFMLGEGAGLGTWRDKTFRFIDTLLEKNIPVLGICFGYQLLALHQGAKIVNNMEMRETGTYDISVNDVGKSDPLFAGLPERFAAQFGHKETIVEPPAHITVLASTNRVACNSFRIAGKPVWGTLSHPELNPARMRDRVKLFPQYTNGKSLDDVLAGFKEAPHAVKLLHNFVGQLRW